MNECRFKIKLVENDTVCSNLTKSKNAKFYEIVSSHNNTNRVAKSDIIAGLVEMSYDLSHGVSRAIIRLPISLSRKIKRLGGEMLSVLISGQAMYLIDFPTINNYLKGEGYTSLSLETISDKELPIQLIKKFPSFYRNRIGNYGNYFIDKIFSKDDIAFVKILDTDSSIMRISELVEILESNEYLFKYYNVKRVLIEVPYDFDKNNLVNISSSFMGRFKSVSKSFVIIYIGQNKKLLKCNVSELVGVGN